MAKKSTMIKVKKALDTVVFLCKHWADSKLKTMTIKMFVRTGSQGYANSDNPSFFQVAEDCSPYINIHVQGDLHIDQGDLYIQNYNEK